MSNDIIAVTNIEAVEERDSTGTRIDTLYRVWSNKDLSSAVVIETTDFRYAMFHQ